ncbi:unnamed protein product [Gongylonema pulchrum]|uniref:Uncharacterized protein n=1 Tax=Gongylonema pulchrum TaxID=637853 RepID=A0A3P6SHN0_9BILA|nr:unnamed protein product [Gongylonema pulchrum]
MVTGRHYGMWKSFSHNECLTDHMDLLTAIRSVSWMNDPILHKYHVEHEKVFRYYK